MPVFQDTDTLYAVMRDMFTQVQEKNPKAFDEMIKTRLTVRFKVTAPNAEFTVDGKTRPAKITYGAFSGRPDIDLELTGDNLDRLLKHEISANKAVMDGTIKFKGNPLKLKAMLDVIKAGNVVYRDVLKAHAL
jgi:putative sterol carrier protein